MATYIHYERFCSACKRYFEGKTKECPKCSGAVKNVNKWYVTFRAEEFGQNKQKKLGAFTTKSEAELAYMQYLSGDNIPNFSYTFLNLVNDVLEREKRENKTSSYVSYKTIYYKRLAELLPLKVTKIGTKELKLIYNKLKISDYSPYTKKATWGALGHALTYAYHNKGIDAPYRAYKTFKRFSTILHKKPSWTADEARQFLATIYAEFEKAKSAAGEKWKESKEAVMHYVFYVLFNYLYYMANRRGEVIALKVDKIDFINNTVTIDENISHKVLPEQRKQGKTYIVTDRKNHQVLTERMPPAIAELLKQYISDLNMKPKDYLFFKTAPINPEMIRRKMSYYVKLANVRPMTPHQFRHTHASIIFSSGNSKIEDAYIVASRLGHSVKYTLDVYGSLYKDREKDIIDNLDF